MAERWGRSSSRTGTPLGSSCGQPTPHSEYHGRRRPQCSRNVNFLPKCSTINPPALNSFGGRYLKGKKNRMKKEKTNEV